MVLKQEPNHFTQKSLSSPYVQKHRGQFCLAAPVRTSHPPRTLVWPLTFLPHLPLSLTTQSTSAVPSPQATHRHPRHSFYSQNCSCSSTSLKCLPVFFCYQTSNPLSYLFQMPPAQCFLFFLPCGNNMSILFASLSCQFYFMWEYSYWACSTSTISHTMNCMK